MKRSKWKINMSSLQKGDFSYIVSRIDEGKKFSVRLGNRLVFSTVKLDMVGFKLGQFFLTKKVGGNIHYKKSKGKKLKRK